MLNALKMAIVSALLVGAGEQHRRHLWGRERCR